ncbi:hypothetical protein KAU19_06280 [Candidatus Parcubacteria bacterium]|nr:hypothetical protein [Candidatus Parcubacteria bacterium]
MAKYFNQRFYLLAVLLIVFCFCGINQIVKADSAATSVVITVCGNSIIEAGEDCEGLDLGGETCVSQGYSSGELACAFNCSFDFSNCVSGAVCGNSIIEAGEDCEGANLNGATCVSLGYASGDLACADSCDYDTSSCVSAPSGGGGGGIAPPVAAETKVILQGKSHSGANLTALKDGQVVTNTESDSMANFKIEIDDITAGTYTFGIWAEDIDGLKSITFNFTVNVQENMITTISGIFIPPTIATDKDNFSIGETINIYGYTAPESRVEVYVSSENPMIYIADADDLGAWNYEIAAAGLGEGSHITKAKSSDPGGLLSTYSKAISFYIGEGTLAESGAGADSNNDGKVDLVDFSILLYWWGKDNETADLNSDNKVDLVDFSIMMYWWTG